MTTYEETSDFPSVRALVDAELLSWLPVVGIMIAPELVDRIRNETERRLAEHVTADGRLQFRSPAHIVAAHKC